MTKTGNQSDGKNLKPNKNVVWKVEDEQSGSIDKISKPKIIDTSKLKKTNRMIRSCSRCKKRKVKCNFEVPCDRCIARNQAHLCTRDPVIFDGLLVSGDKQELKFSKENEVLKKKIKELQETILKMKSALNNKESYNDVSKNVSSSEINPHEDFEIVKMEMNGSMLQDESAKPLSPNFTEKMPKSLQSWNTYSTTISLLDKGLANGLVLDNTKFKNLKMDYNTEEWLILNDKKYINYKAEDSKGKVWQYQLDLISGLGKETCDILVKCGLKFLILFPVINSIEYLEEYEKYWADTDNEEKHVTEVYSKTAPNYVFMSVMYALMCTGVYQCDKESEKKLNFDINDWDNYPKAFFGASLECLCRGRYLTHPNFYSIQTIAILRPLSGLLGGNILSNNLTCVSFFISYKLKLSKSLEKIKRNNLWNMLAYDWYEEQDRYPLTDLKILDKIPKMETWINESQGLLDWSNYYLRFQLSISVIKRKYYYEAPSMTLEMLKKADIELRYLEIQASRDISSFNPTKYPDISDIMISYIQFHIENLVHHEILEVNLKMSAFMSYEEWLSLCYDTCYHNAISIIKKFISDEFPLSYKSYAIICTNVVYAAVFLLVDCMLDEKHYKYQKEVLREVKQISPVFRSFKSVIRGAVRGLYVIEKLMSLLTTKQKEKQSFKKNKRKNAIKGIPKKQNVTPVGTFNIMEDISIHVKQEIQDGESDSNLVYSGSDSSEDNDMPLYYSTLINQKNANTISRAPKVEQPIETVGNVSASFMDQGSNISGNIESISETTKQHNGKGKINIEIQETVKCQTPGSTFSEMLCNSVSTPSSQPQIHHKIMDILEDSGWVQFINSIDDLDL